MKEFWNARYGENEYAYGIEPNEFFREKLDELKLGGKVLFPADGEGRNGVYAATKGLEVYAFDTSEEGKNKALKLAEEKGVQITYETGDFFELSLSGEKYNAAVLIYAHLPPEIRKKVHQRIAELIVPGGYIILEGFSVNNIPFREKNPEIGGPPQEDFLFTTEMVREEFPGFDEILLEEKVVELKEGLYHNGEGSVVRYVGRKN